MIRVVICDDSALSRAILKTILEAEGDIQVVGEATNGLEAVPKVRELSPDLLTMDVHMPGQSGLETVEQVMQAAPVPILLVTGENLGPESDIGFRAIQLGALDFMAKPPITDAASTALLREHVRRLAKIPVFRHVEGQSQNDRQTAPPPEVPSSNRGGYGIIAIASGTGGPKGLAAIAAALPEDFGCPIVVVQHLPDRFASSFATYLQSLTQLEVVLVDALPHDLRAGQIVLAKTADAHLVCPSQGVVVSMEEPPFAGHRPSASVLLRSVAETYGRGAIGLVLSGTGEDGLAGIAAMHDVGALTIAESPDTALVPELPAAALAAGAVSRILPTEMIADYLVATLSNASSKTTVPPTI